MNSEELKQWCHNYQTNASDIPLIMGILNITPDSFYDGGRFNSPAKALEQALQMVHAGADVIDIGGESTQPGAPLVSVQEELDRVIPVIEKLRQETDQCLSIDTSKWEVMQEAVKAGVTLVNDVYALRKEHALSVVAALDCQICLMHMQGEPQTMQEKPHYADVIDEVNQFFYQRLRACEQAGITADRIILDPGFGFGKTVVHNLQIIKQFEKLKQHQRPLMLGVSRKSTIGKVLGQTADERLIGGLALTVLASQKGLNMIRTHDVCATKQALIMTQAVLTAGTDRERTQR